MTGPAVEAEALTMWGVEVGGVRGAWVPAEGPFQIQLTFGVGMRDEDPVRRGITHLLEHVTLHGLGHGSGHLEFNGFVSVGTTAFTARGTQAEVQQVLDHVGRALRSLAGQDLEHERRVLRAEANARGGSVLGHHLSRRHGMLGAGLLGEEELGLRWLRASDLQQWADRWFHAGNAAIAAVGPDPRQLRLDLPTGTRSARQPLPPTILPGPSWTLGPDRQVALSLELPRTPVGRVAEGVLRTAATARLRHADALSYGVELADVATSADTTVVLLAADCQDEHVDAVREALTVELTRLRTAGPTVAEVEDVRIGLRRAFSDQRAAMALASEAVGAMLEGTEVRSPIALRDQLLSVDAAEVAAVLDVACDHLVWTVPRGHEVRDRRFEGISHLSTTAVGGTSFEPSDLVAPECDGDRLVIGAEGASIVIDDGRMLTVRWADVCVVRQYQDRTWIITTRDDRTLNVIARAWYPAAQVASELVRHLPAGCIVDMGEPAATDDPDCEPAGPLRVAPPPPPPTDHGGPMPGPRPGRPDRRRPRRRAASSASCAGLAPHDDGPGSSCDRSCCSSCGSPPSAPPPG